VSLPIYLASVVVHGFTSLLMDTYCAGYETILPPSCVREFGKFERYYCAACDPGSPDFLDHESRTLFLCSSFSDSILGSDRGNFDKCGLKVDRGVGECYNLLSKRRFVFGQCALESIRMRSAMVC